MSSSKMLLACNRIMMNAKIFLLALFSSVILTACGGGGGGSGGAGGGGVVSPTSYSIGGTVSGLAVGNSITLSDNGSDSISVSANGTFTFNTKLPSSQAYSVTLSSTSPVVQPCSVTYGSGTMGVSNISNINVFCGPSNGGAPYWRLTGTLQSAREYHTATLLQNGMVLVVGGTDGTNILSSAEIYNPTTGLWSLTGPLATARMNHTSSLLTNGMVLVAGGVTSPNSTSNGNAVALTSAEIFNPSTGVWTSTGALSTTRFNHTASLLPNGKVAVVGGFDTNTGILKSIEIYDASSGIWTVGNPMLTEHTQHTATLLPSGKIFVTGGYRNNISTNSSQASFDSELYDPATGLWSTTAALTFARFDHTATLLPNGKVLIAGGAYVSNPNPALATNLTELYDSATGQMSTISSSGLARYWQTSSLLPSGKVLMAGGTGGVLVYDISELFDPTTSSWNTATPLLNARYSHTSTTLQSGAILVVGGVFSNTYPGVILNTSELFY